MRRELADYAMAIHAVSLRCACRVVGLSDSVYRYRPDANRDDALIATLQAVSERYPAYGFSKLLKVMRRQGLSLEPQAYSPGVLRIKTQ